MVSSSKLQVSGRNFQDSETCVSIIYMKSEFSFKLPKTSFFYLKLGTKYLQAKIGPKTLHNRRYYNNTIFIISYFAAAADCHLDAD